ncbi:MAG: hypothetical protein AAGI15_04215 [Pseudomonadota bacterium]
MIELAQVEAPLTLFVEGMAGTYLHVRPTGAYDGHAPLSAFASQSADAIYLPESLPGERAADYRVLAMQQVAQRLFGTFELTLPALVATGVNFGDHPTAGTRDAIHAEARLGPLHRLRLRYRLPWLFQNLFECFESARLDARTVQAYPGLRRHYLAWHRDTGDRAASAPTGVFPPQVDPAAALTLQMELGALHERRDAERRHWLAGSALPVDALIAPLCRDSATVIDSVLLADASYRALTATLDLASAVPATAPAPAATPETSADWMERKVRLKDWEMEQAGLKTLLMNAELLDPADVDAAENEGLAGDIKPEGVSLKKVAKAQGGLDPDALERKLAMERSALRHALGEERTLARSYRYDEWDQGAGRYRPRWCCLYESDLDPDPEVDGRDLAARVRPWRDEIRARLSQIKPLGYVRQRGLEDGDELDFNAVLDARLDAAAGRSPDERVYSRKDRLQRDLVCAFLIDLSASTDDPMVDASDASAAREDPADAEPANLRDPWSMDDDLEFEPPQQRRRIIDVQREAMLAMASALETLGDEYGIYGFSGYGRDNVEYYVAKAIGASFTQRTLHSIAAMKPRRSTRMGPAIRHTTQKLLQSGHAMKLMIMLSDGFPQDSDYGPVRGEHDYGVADTARAIEEAEALGIRTFCITVDQSGHDYLARMCPSEQYLIINETAELPAALSKVYARLAS